MLKLKSFALKAVIWSFIQRGGTLVIGFITNIILARLLTPEDFGCVGIILVFVSIADILVDGGLGSALINKKKLTKEDISTVFVSNLLISISIFILLYLSAPHIANVFDKPELKILIRIESIAIIIRAFYVIQHSLLNKELKFKDITTINLISVSVAAIVGIIMAYLNYGVWSLIGKNITQQFMLCILFWVKKRVNQKFIFNIISFKELFNYGWFIALTNMLDVLYSSLTSFIIGKSYSLKDLGYFNQAHSLQQIPTYSLSMVINQVFFPYLSKVKDDCNMINIYSRKVVSMTSFAIMPLMTFLICFAKEIIIVIYSQKWVLAAEYFQILCISGIFNAFIHINRNILKSIGKTKLLFNLQLTITIIGIVMLIIFSNFNIKILLLSIVMFSFINWLSISILAGKEIGFDIIKQIRVIVPSFIISVISGIIAIVLNKYYYTSLHIIVELSCNIIVFIFSYFVLHYTLKTKSFSTFIEIIYPNHYKQK